MCLLYEERCFAVTCHTIFWIFSDCFSLFRQIPGDNRILFRIGNTIYCIERRVVDATTKVKNNSERSKIWCGILQHCKTLSHQENHKIGRTMWIMIERICLDNKTKNVSISHHTQIHFHAHRILLCRFYYTKTTKLPFS